VSYVETFMLRELLAEHSSLRTKVSVERQIFGHVSGAKEPQQQQQQRDLV